MGDVVRTPARRTLPVCRIRHGDLGSTTPGDVRTALGPNTSFVRADAWPTTSPVSRAVGSRAVRHHNLGIVATLGRGHGAFSLRTGGDPWPARGAYRPRLPPARDPHHERLLTVLGDWSTGTISGRDTVSLESVQTLRAAFVDADDSRLS